LYVHIKPYLAEEDGCVMSHLYLSKRLLDTIQTADVKALPFNSPTNDGQSVTVDGVHVYLPDMKISHDELMDEIENNLDRLLWQGFKLDQDLQIQDDPRNLNAGYSFVNDLHNPWTQETTTLQHILATPELLNKFGSTDIDGHIHWYPGACMRYMADIHNLQRLIIIALILVSGQPGRAVEYACALLSNVPGGSIRNVFWLMDTFFLRGSYNKTSHQSSEDKTMARVPLPRLGRLIARFLIYLRPLYSEWQYHFHPKLYANSRTFLFAGLYRPISARDISIFLAQYTHMRFGVRFTVRTFRQVMAYIMSHFEEELDVSRSTTSASHVQLGHTGEMDRNNYGHDARLPAGLHRSELMVTARVSAIIHMIFGHPPTLLSMLERGAAFRARLRETISSVRSTNLSSVVQDGGRSPPTSLTIDALGDALSSRLLPDLISYNRSALVEAHASVIDLLFRGQSFSKSTTLPSPVIACPHPSILRKFRQFMKFPGDSTMGFKNLQQGIIIEMMYQRKQHIVYVSPTGHYPKLSSCLILTRLLKGSGKTMPGLFCASVLDQGRSTVWILPLRSMHEQYHARCKEYDMRSKTWSPQMTITGVPVHILVSVESTDWQVFRAFLGALHALDGIARIIFDEAHLALTHDSFRPVMDTLKWIGGMGIQVVLPTATLPPSLEQRLIEKTGLTGCYISRSKTPRANISFNVVRSATPNGVLDAVHAEYQKARRHSATGRILVFCGSKKHARETAEKLAIPSCDSSMTLEEIDLLLTQFRNGQVLGIACTSLLGVALDVPNVTHVIHRDYPWDALSFTQEVGRLGRDASTEKAWSIVVLPPQAKTPVAPNDDPYGKHLLRRSLDSEEYCRRLLVQTFMDGVAEPCSLMEGKAHFCDVCEAHSHDQPSPFLHSVFPSGLISTSTTGVIGQLLWLRLTIHHYSQ
jgi:hypothetical protein